MAPDDPFYAVGDIHGRLDLFERLMDRIGRDVEDQGHDSSRIVFLGDYIDRETRQPPFSIMYANSAIRGPERRSASVAITSR